MDKHRFIVATVDKWVREHRDWLRVHGIREAGVILNVGLWLDLEAELAAEARRLYDARQYEESAAQMEMELEMEAA